MYSFCYSNKCHFQAKKSALLIPTANIIGNYIATIRHLEYLIENISKDQHCLVQSDINSKDKMNYDSSVKMSSNMVLYALKKYVNGSEATINYLKLMQYIRLSYSEVDVNIKQRIYYIWYVTFYLRIWKHWIKCEGKVLEYSVKSNFISENALN